MEREKEKVAILTNFLKSKTISSESFVVKESRLVLGVVFIGINKIRRLQESICHNSSGMIKSNIFTVSSKKMRQFILCYTLHYIILYIIFSCILCIIYKHDIPLLKSLLWFSKSIGLCLFAFFFSETSFPSPKNRQFYLPRDHNIFSVNLCNLFILLLMS